MLSQGAKTKRGRGRPATKSKSPRRGPKAKISPAKTPASKRYGRPPTKIGRSATKSVAYNDEIDSDEFEGDEESEEDEEDSEDDDYSEDEAPRSRKRPLSTPRGRPLKTPKDKFPPVSEMVIESIKALKDNPK